MRVLDGHRVFFGFGAIVLCTVLAWDIWSSHVVEQRVELAQNLIQASKRALYAYYQDHGVMPSDDNGRLPEKLDMYLYKQLGSQQGTDRVATMPIDPFATTNTMRSAFADPYSGGARRETLRYLNRDGYFVLLSVGPDGDVDLPLSQFVEHWDCRSVQNWRQIDVYEYDPANGLKSNGDIFDIICKHEWQANLGY